MYPIVPVSEVRVCGCAQCSREGSEELAELAVGVLAHHPQVPG